MSQEIGSSLYHSVLLGLDIVKEVGRQIVTFDRSNRIYGVTPEAQLKARSKNILISKITMAVAVVWLGCALLATLSHPGLGNYLAIGFAGASGLLALKEGILQSIARQKDKAKYPTLQESDETTYGVGDWLEEYRNYSQKPQEYTRKLKPEETKGLDKLGKKEDNEN